MFFILIFNYYSKGIFFCESCRISEYIGYFYGVIKIRVVPFKLGGWQGDRFNCLMEENISQIRRYLLIGEHRHTVNVRRGTFSISYRNVYFEVVFLICICKSKIIMMIKPTFRFEKLPNISTESFLSFSNVWDW